MRGKDRRAGRGTEEEEGKTEFGKINLSDTNTRNFGLFRLYLTRTVKSR